MIQLAGQLVPVKLDAQKDGKELAEKFGIQGVPTILFLDADGTRVGGITGYLPPKQFGDEMERQIKAQKLFPGLVERLQKDAKDVEALGQIVPIYAGRGDVANAESHLARLAEADPKNEKGLLSKAYAAVGDHYQEKKQFAQAIPLFRKAQDAGKETGEIAYARLSIAACSVDSGDAATAVTECEAVLKMEGLPAEDKEAAERLLAAAKGGH